MNKKVKNMLICVSVTCLCFINSSGLNLYNTSVNLNKSLNNTEKMNKKVEKIFTYADNQLDTYPTTQAAYKFAELVKDKSDGRIEIVVKGEGNLGDEKSVIDQLKFGGVDFAKVSVSAISDEIPKLRIFEMPYIFEDGDHQLRVLEGNIGKRILNDIEYTNLNVKGLVWYDAGARHFYSSDRPIEKLEDFSGMKIRVQESEVMKAMIEYLGANPVEMTYEKVYSGLQLGDLEAAENNWPSYESEKHYKVAGYMTETFHSRVPDVLLCSLTAWNELSKEDKEIILECAEEASKFERQLWKQRERSAKERTTRNGVKVTEIPTNEMQRFKQVLEPLYEQFCKEYMYIIDEIKSLVN